MLTLNCVEVRNMFAISFTLMKINQTNRFIDPAKQKLYSKNALRKNDTLNIWRQMQRIKLIINEY